jgi:DNA-directed RNA polymerase beta subunit
MQSMLLFGSDAYEAPICTQCGLTAIPPAPREVFQRHSEAEIDESRFDGAPFCQNCRRGDTVRSVTIPDAFKLLGDELSAMNIAMRIRLDDTVPTTK